MAKKKENWTMSDWRDYYEKLRQKASDDYQSTGDGRYDNREHQYSVIVDAFNGCIAYRDEVDEDRMRRRRNLQAYADKLQGKENFTLGEVKKILDDVSWF